MKKQTKSGLIWVWLTVAVILVDIATKYFVNHEMELGQSVQVFTFLNIALSHNVGAAFNFLSNQAGWQQWLFGMIALLVSIFIFVWLWRLPRKAHWTGAALSLILAGALGNLYDRLVYGYVIDYIDFHVGSWHWPSFNVADSSIVIGVIILIVCALFRKEGK